MKGHPAGLRVAVFDEEGRELVGLVAVDPIPNVVQGWSIDVRDERHPRSRYTTQLLHDAALGPWALLQDALGQVVGLTAGRASPADLEPATLARWFHEAYERLAPEHGYRTREASAVPWDDVPEANRALMVATAREVLARMRAGRR